MLMCKKDCGSAADAASPSGICRVVQQHVSAGLGVPQLQVFLSGILAQLVQHMLQEGPGQRAACCSWKVAMMLCLPV